MSILSDGPDDHFPNGWAAIGCLVTLLIFIFIIFGFVIS